MNSLAISLTLYLLGWGILIAVLVRQQMVIRRQADLIRNAHGVCDALLQEARRLGKRLEQLERKIKEQNEGDWWKNE